MDVKEYPMVEMLKDENLATHFIKEKYDDGRMEFIVYEINAWDTDNNPLFDENMDEIVSGVIKWDGCSHLYFGEEEENPQTHNQERDGYLHLCGKGCFTNLKRVLDELWRRASVGIKNWDADVAS